MEEIEYTEIVIEALEHYRKNRSCNDVSKVDAVCKLHDQIFKPATPTNKTCGSCKGRAFQRLLSHYDKRPIQGSTSELPAKPTKRKQRGRPRKKK